MKNHNYTLEYERRQALKKKILRGILAGIAALAGILVIAFLLYVGDYYHADEDAATYLYGSDRVKVSEFSDGYFFDGSGDDTALVFYPGAKVEYTAYAPLMFDLAQGGVDCFLIKMPWNLAIFGVDKAGDVMAKYGYTSWYVGGHSLGGAMAAKYVNGKITDSNTANDPAGLILLASFSTVDLRAKPDLQVLTIYGSNDGVLDREKLNAQTQLLPDSARTVVIQGGNHAQFGDYGRQNKDGDASITKEQQWEETTAEVLEFLAR